MPVSVFVREAVLREADSAIAADSVVTLSEAETRRFLAAEQGKGYGRLLLGHAANLARSVRQTMGVRVLMADSSPSRPMPLAGLYLFFGLLDMRNQ